ncbi:hypothetical protein [Dyadobacter sandarakinus]|uniref:Phage protein n=1 Tax=Dyadobacter sandarakinus TaxID=2747268 RepID=A0ABX7I2G5_9BACT|nr:hypothetical protein [Dyadobacter sandarakinus]QRQ99711.1 hypothetical protein HWI92_01665 [Dyadobacter sandarakinus]
MKGKVIKPIPGTGYSIGEVAQFNGERYAEYFESGHIELIKEEPETATAKPELTADTNPVEKATSHAKEHAARHKPKK